MFQDYRDRAAFLFVYIHEAHPSDGWQLESNEAEEVVFPEPRRPEERRAAAASCAAALALTMPCLVDTMDNAVDEAYAAWPERLFVISESGDVAYAGAQGPFGFDPAGVAAWLHEHVGPPRPPPAGS